MKIALCADGLSPHAQRWANGLADRDLDVAFLWAGDEPPSAELARFRPSISHHTCVAPARLMRPWTAPVAARAARRLARRLQPDIVHGLYLYGHGWTAHALGVRPLVLSALGSDVLNLRRERRGSVAHSAADAYGVWRTRAAVAAADVVLADSTAIAASVRERVPGTETRIIRFGVEVSSPPESARSDWRRRLDIGEDAFVLLSSRLVRPRYNIDTIIRALAVIRRRFPTAVLILKELPRFSDPAYRRHCLELVEELGLSDAVRVIGELDRDELLELQAAADVYISVPTTDGTSVSVLEAMVAGVAIVATDASGVDPNILRREETALLVPTRDPESLASAVVALGLDDELRRKLVERARDVALLHGNFDHELDRAVLLYEELVAARARAHCTGSRG